MIKFALKPKSYEVFFLKLNRADSYYMNENNNSDSLTLEFPYATIRGCIINFYEINRQS